MSLGEISICEPIEKKQPESTLSVSQSPPSSLQLSKSCSTTDDKESLRELSLIQSKIFVEYKGLLCKKCYRMSFEKDKNNKSFDILRAESDSMLKSGEFSVYSKTNNIFVKQPANSISNHDLIDPNNNKWNKISNLSSPGWLFNKTVISTNKKVSGSVMYDCTSRTGDLMKMKVVLPKMHEEKSLNIIKLISTTTILPNDCAYLITQFIGIVSYSKNISIDLSRKGLNTLQKSNDIVCLQNKLPTWNAQLSAYTLEFGGRAKMPSVHNFQLSYNDDDNIILQLGKVSKEEFNLDYAHPLTPLQAFSICISVIDRSFVWD